MAQDNAQARIIKARIRLLLDQPFFGNLLLYLEPVEKKDMAIRTMATDGEHLFYDSDFVRNLTESQLVGVMVHEVGHIALRHLARRQSRNPMKFNIAADFAVNDLILSTINIRGLRVFDLPSGVLFNPTWHDKTAEWIYNQLPDMNGTSGEPKTLDDHGEWSNGGEKDSGGTTEQEWKDRIAKAAVDARTRGKLPGNWKTVIDDFLQPKLDWRSILTDMLVSNAKNDYRLFPPNKKHLWRGLYLPSLRGEEINIAMYIDCSGSIRDKEIQAALSEVQGICQQFPDYTIYLRTFDTRITGAWELHAFDQVPKVISGRGGTDFSPIIEDVEKLPVSMMVIFSDLCAPFPPAPQVPAIWLSVGDATPPWGTVINYPRLDN
jgi:predicted metal-dependent peptidase